MPKKPSKPRLKFKPILLKRGMVHRHPTEQFHAALQACEHLTVVESAKKITFTLTKARTKVV